MAALWERRSPLLFLLPCDLVHSFLTQITMQDLNSLSRKRSLSSCFWIDYLGNVLFNVEPIYTHESEIKLERKKTRQEFFYVASSLV